MTGLVLVAFLLFNLSAMTLTLQSAVDANELLARASDLYARGDWQAVVQLVPASSSNPAELDYLRGMALARLGDRQEARRCLEAGLRKAPSDKRFPQELAGLAFQANQFPTAKAYLFRALTVDRQDPYTHEFLGSIFLMEDNLDAALKYWNPIGKPHIETIQTVPQSRLKPELLDHAFQFAPGSVLRLEELTLTRASLEQLGIFPRYRFELLPRPDSGFDLAFHPLERHGVGEGLLDSMISVLRGAPAQVLYLDLYNLGGRATNWISLYRWHAQKRRLFSSLTGIWREDPRWGYIGWGDWRQENWDLSRSFQGTTPVSGDLRLHTQKAGVDLCHLVSGRWKWTAGVEGAHRQYQNPPSGVSGSEGLFTNGTSLKYQTTLDYQLLSVPERGLVVWSSGRGEIARQFGQAGFVYSRLRGDVQARWLPNSNGKDYALRVALHAGKGLGALPFDELAMLGMERENDLLLHGHPGSYRGKKGNAYLGRDFLLLNTDFDRRLYKHPWFDVRLGPLLDVGKTFDESGRFSSPMWLWDLGVQAKVQVQNGSTLSVSYGKSLRDSQSVLFITFSK